MENSKPVKKRPGRIPGAKTIKATLLLPPDLIEWGKRQPEGLSALVRELLEEARKQRS